MAGKKILIGIVCIIAVMALSATVYASQFYPLQGVEKSNYEAIVAKIGSVGVTGKQLTGQIQLEKNKWERIGYPQNETFYEKAALRQLVLNEQIKNIAREKGISITDEEVSNYLNNAINVINKLSVNDQNRIQFYNDMEASGYNNVQDYANSPKVIEATKDVLIRTQFKQLILSSVPLPSDAEVNSYITKNKLNISNPEKRVQLKYQLHQINLSEKWDEYTEELIAKDNYESFTSIDIKDFKYPEIKPEQNQFYKGNIKQ